MKNTNPVKRLVVHFTIEIDGTAVDGTAWDVTWRHVKGSFSPYEESDMDFYGYDEVDYKDMKLWGDPTSIYLCVGKSELTAKIEKAIIESIPNEEGE